jgi:hypothetical protein
MHFPLKATMTAYARFHRLARRCYPFTTVKFVISVQRSLTAEEVKSVIQITSVIPCTFRPPVLQSVWQSLIPIVSFRSAQYCMAEQL